MRKILYTMFFAISILGTASASNIGIVNLEKVMTQSEAFKSIASQMEKKGKEFKAELEKDEKALTAQRDSIATQSKLLSQEAMREKMVDLEKNFVALQEKARNREQTMYNAEMTAGGELTNHVREIVAEMAKEKGYEFDIVLASATALYVKESSDISAEVLKRLNKRVKTIKVKF